MDRRRLWQIILLLALLPAMWRIVRLAGSGGEPLRQEAERLSRHEGELAAIRGRIYDGSGLLLAWSERHYDLYWTGPVLPEPVAAKLQKSLPDRRIISAAAPGEKLLLLRDLTLSEAEAVDALAVRYPALTMELRWERCRIDDAVLRTLIGEVQVLDGQEQGVSGWEAEFEEQLGGRNGRYTVLLDRHGRWIDRTFRQIEPPEAGEDVHLALDRERLCAPETTEDPEEDAEKSAGEGAL